MQLNWKNYRLFFIPYLSKKLFTSKIRSFRFGSLSASHLTIIAGCVFDALINHHPFFVLTLIPSIVVTSENFFNISALHLLIISNFMLSLQNILISGVLINLEKGFNRLLIIFFFDKILSILIGQRFYGSSYLVCRNYESRN